MRSLGRVGALVATAVVCGACGNSGGTEPTGGCAPGTVALDQTRSGVLTPGDCTDAASVGEFYDEYALEARQGQSYLLHVESNQFDTELFLLSAEGAQNVLAYSDDYRANSVDFRESTNSELFFVAPSAQRLLVRVRAFEPGTGGGYVLTVRSCGGDRITANTTITGASLSASDCVVHESHGMQPRSPSHADFYSVHLNAGDRKRFAVSGTGFDPAMVMGVRSFDFYGGPAAYSNTFAVRNDTLELSVFETGDYLLIVGAEAFVTGAYTLTMSDMPPAAGITASAQSAHRLRSTP
ncbi:MAG: hypothetical protein ABR499_18240 [Gemmatimonadaceae bacterium]